MTISMEYSTIFSIKTLYEYTNYSNMKILLENKNKV